MELSSLWNSWGIVRQCGETRKIDVIGLGEFWSVGGQFGDPVGINHISLVLTRSTSSICICRYIIKHN